MKYNFDESPKRYEIESYKWKMGADVIPLWVADQDFYCAKPIKDALNKRINDDAFGYSYIPDEYFIAFKNFYKRHYDIVLNTNDMIFTTGAVPAISSIVRRVTDINDNVLLLTPTYNIFYNSVLNNKRIVITSDLVLKDNNFEIDFIDLEIKMKDPKTKLMIMANPLNPIGRIITKYELNKINELANKYNVIVISDEVHGPLTSPSIKYIPYESISNTGISILSASKAFNIAGLQGACVVCQNKELKAFIERGFNNDEVAEGNCFVYRATIAALTECDDYLAELNEYIENNKNILNDFIRNNNLKLNYIRGNATYLAWVDFSYYSFDTKALCDKLLDEYKVYLAYGEEYGVNFKTYIRINLATPKGLLIEGLNRLNNALKNIKKKEC